MFVRMVNIHCKKGMDDELKRIGRDVLVSVNKEAGCENVYFLEPSLEHHNSLFGVVSVWKNEEDLDNMKNSDKYQALLQELAPIIESITDCLYVTN